MDGLEVSWIFFFFGFVCSCLLTYLHVPHIVRVEKERNALQFWGSFFFDRWVLTVLCLLTMFDFGEFVHLVTSFLRYCTYSSDDVLLLLMMMIHSLLDLIRRARTLCFMVHGSILLYWNHVHITCTSLSNHALLFVIFVITHCYESLVHCVSLLLG